MPLHRAIPGDGRGGAVSDAMSDATSAPPGRRWPWIAGAAVFAVVVAIGIGEATGWRLLVAPMQHWLTNALDRRVEFGPDAGGADGVRIGLIGSVRMRAPMIEIGAPAWSKAPHMVLARNAQLEFGYGDLWRAYRGSPLRVRQLHADQLDAQIERLADGRASWQFGPPKPEDPAQVTRLPSFGELRVGDGTLVFRDAVLEADLEARFALTERSTGAEPGSLPASGSAAPVQAASASWPSDPAASAAGNAGLQLQATGKYRKLPLKVELSTSGVLELAGPDAEQTTQPVTLDATIGRATLRFKGVTRDALHLTALRGRFDVAGPSLAAVGDPLGVTLPTTGAFKTHGFLAKEGGLWKAVFVEAKIGGSRLDGAFTFDRRQEVPLLSGRLNGSRLVLADLGPVVGTTPRHAPSGKPAEPSAKLEAPGGRVLPDRRFDLPSLRAMNANVLIDIAYLDLGTSLLEPLKPLRTHLRLLGGVLTLSDIDARSAEGRLTGDAGFDGRQSQALWTVDLRLLGVRLERWLHQQRKSGAPAYITGRMDGQVKIAGRGRSTAEILGSLNGAMRFHLRNATISHLAVEAAGIDLAEALGVFLKGDDSLAIECNVADFSVENGLARPRLFVLDTRDSAIWVEGSLSLQSEALDLTAIVSPKDFSPLTLRTPIHVKGTFAVPSVLLEKSKLGAKVGAAALLSLLNPLAALIPFIDPGSSDDAKREAAQCAALAQRSNLARVPASKPTPK